MKRFAIKMVIDLPDDVSERDFDNAVSELLSDVGGEMIDSERYEELEAE